MDFEKYTDRSRGFIQSAQSLAQREGHQQFSTEHLLKVLLDDPEGLAAGLIDRAGGNSRAALTATEAALAKRPKISGGGAGQIYLDPALARVFETAEKAGEKAGDSYVTVERLLLALALEKTSEAGKILSQCRGHAANAQCGDRGFAQGPHRRLGLGGECLRRAEKIRPRPDPSGARRQARSRDRTRRGNPPHHPGAVAAHEK